MTPLIRPPATFSPQAGRRSSREVPRPAKRGEGAAKRRVRGRVITASSAQCAASELRMTLADGSLCRCGESSKRHHARQTELLRHFVDDADRDQGGLAVNEQLELVGEVARFGIRRN